MSSDHQTPVTPVRRLSPLQPVASSSSLTDSQRGLTPPPGIRAPSFTTQVLRSTPLRDQATASTPSSSRALHQDGVSASDPRDTPSTTLRAPGTESLHQRYGISPPTTRQHQHPTQPVAGRDRSTAPTAAAGAAVDMVRLDGRNDRPGSSNTGDIPVEGADDQQQQAIDSSSTSLFYILTLDDTLRQRVVKQLVIAMVAVHCSLAVVAAAAYLPQAISEYGASGSGDARPHMVVALLPLIQSLVIQVPAYVYCRHQREAVSIVVDVMLLFTSLTVGLVGLAELVFPTHPALFVAALLVAITASPRWYLHLLVITCFWWLSVANTTAMVTSVDITALQLPAAIAGGSQPRSFSSYATQAAIFLIAGIVVYFVHAIASAADELDSRSRRTAQVVTAFCDGLVHLDASRMARIAETALQEYKTLEAAEQADPQDGAQEAKPNADHAQRYRQQPSSGPRADEPGAQTAKDEGDEEATSTKTLRALPQPEVTEALMSASASFAAVLPHIPQWLQSSIVAGLIGNSAHAIEAEIMERAAHSSHAPHNDKMLHESPPEEDADNELDASPVAAAQRSQQRKTAAYARLLRLTGVAKALDTPTVRYVTQACVDVCMTAPQGGGSSFPAYGALLTSVSKFALAFKCATHTLVGDQIVGTWNATGLCLQHEYLAVKFVWRLRARPGHDSLSCSGSVVSFDARCQNVLTGTVGHFIASPLQGTTCLRQLSELAREHRTVLIDAATFRGFNVQRDFLCRGIDEVQQHPRLPPFQTTARRIANDAASSMPGSSQPSMLDVDEPLSPLGGSFFDQSASDFDRKSPVPPSPLEASPASTAWNDSSSMSSNRQEPATLVFEVVRFNSHSKAPPANAAAWNELRKSCDLTTSALMSCVNGRYAEAVAVLTSLPASHLRHRLVQRLLEQAAMCLETGRVPGGSFATRHSMRPPSSASTASMNVERSGGGKSGAASVNPPATLKQYSPVVRRSQ